MYLAIHLTSRKLSRLVPPLCGDIISWTSQISYILIILIKYEYPILSFYIFEIINLNHKKIEIRIFKFSDFQISDTTLYCIVLLGYTLFYWVILMLSYIKLY